MKKTSFALAHPKAFDTSLLSWTAPEYAHHEKSAVWFMIAGAIALALIIYGFLTDGWTFSLAVIAFCGSYYLFHCNKPPMVEVKISKFGIKIGHHRFPFTHIKFFWVVYEPPFVSKLYLRMTSKMHPDVFVNLDDVDVTEVRRVLSLHVDEIKGIHEPFADTLVRLLRL